MSAPINFGRLYHTGIVVDDVEAAKTEYSDLLGVTWGFQGENDMPVWFPDGARTLTFRYAYTVEGPHRLELVGPIPGTLWSVSRCGQPHHFGYWCDDIAGVCAALEQRGLEPLAKLGVTEPDQVPMIAFFEPRAGGYIELVDSSLRAQMFPDEA
jgi:hypothetical protein